MMEGLSYRYIWCEAKAGSNVVFYDAMQMVIVQEVRGKKMFRGCSVQKYCMKRCDWEQI